MQNVDVLLLHYLFSTPLTSIPPFSYFFDHTSARLCWCFAGLLTVCTPISVHLLLYINTSFVPSECQCSSYLIFVSLCTLVSPRLPLAIACGFTCALSPCASYHHTDLRGRLPIFLPAEHQVSHRTPSGAYSLPSILPPVVLTSL